MYTLSAEIEETDGRVYYILIVEAGDEEPLVIAHGDVATQKEAIEKIKEGLSDVL
jgi:hypothetical protein